MRLVTVPIRRRLGLALAALSFATMSACSFKVSSLSPEATGSLDRSSASSVIIEPDDDLCRQAVRELQAEKTAPNRRVIAARRLQGGLCK